MNAKVETKKTRIKDLSREQQQSLLNLLTSHNHRHVPYTLAQAKAMECAGEVVVEGDSVTMYGLKFAWALSWKLVA